MQLNNPDLFRQSAFIAGRWCQADSGETLTVDNPATGEILGPVPNMGAEETRRAIAHAKIAMTEWARKTGKERGAILRRWHDLVVAHRDDLATIMVCEQGKSLTDAHGELQSGINYLDWFSEEAKRVYGDYIPAHQADKRLVVIKQPVGVTAAITPWNFPHSMISRKAGAALAVGCAMVVKPATETPFSALAMAVLAQEAGIPDGVYNVVTGDAPAIGAEMTANPTVRKLSFTGSTAVGQLLMRQCADTVKKISLELGGNSPFIVFADADVARAVDDAMRNKFRNSGQTCISVNRFFVHRSVCETFSQQLVEKVSQLKLGNGLHPDTTQGPLIHQRAVERTEALIQDAVKHGAEILLGGKRADMSAQMACMTDNFFQPTVITGVTPNMRIAQEEIFAPVASIIPFDDEAQAIAQANDTPYGLAGYFYSRDIARIWRVAEALQVGMVGVNTAMMTSEVAPFGGTKASGIGREGSKYGIEDYLETKTICFGV